jgi:hypothetical protein
VGRSEERLVSLWATIILVGFFVIGLSARFRDGNPMRAVVVLAAVVLIAMRALVW